MSLRVFTTPEADVAQKIVLLHRTCSPTNSRRRSTSLGTRHISGARIGNPRYRTCVVSYSRELAITSTMCPGVIR